ncbi:MAG: calcium-translocating P-type ATPase, PMCA-type [Oscillospiraceae bacterium]|nr:calcium-translocating P-type ATPase, PMCA-type [Oscillospiraceae bacterium]
MQRKDGNTVNHYLESVSTVLEKLKSAEGGLSREEAAKRLLENGRNELDKAKKKSLARRLMEQLANPMVLILLVAAAVSVAIAVLERGSVNEYAEAGIILAVVILNSVLGVFQESKAEKAIEALQEMSAATAKVRRGGTVAQLPAAELVTGDIVLLEAGDAVPADMRLIQCACLRVEEAALTGESVPVDKKTGALPGGDSGKVPLGDRKNMAYMGSGVAYGRGEGVVTATGMETEMGKIAGIIQSTEEGDTPLQKRLAGLSKILTVLVLAICVIIFAVQMIRERSLSVDVILPSFMLAVSLAVAAIPEGLAAVVTIVLSIGVTNMAKRSAIIRRLTAVETLGCAQVICSDKTGTLTQNKMTVVESCGEEKLLASAMALCCDSRLAPDGEIVGDPTENALVAFALKKGLDKNALEAEFPRVGEAPFDSMRKMMSTIHQAGEGLVQYTKGAPDEILRVCSHALLDGKAVPLNEEILRGIVEKNSAFADRALRVLACAYKDLPSLPERCEATAIENGLTFIGLEAMIDPVRPEVRAAVDECRSSGIKVVMITGDHKETAAAIARELGIIESAGQAITGRELDELSDEEFGDRIGQLFVYARVQPEHKVRIVNMWKEKGHVTAMTGDGVNDAPAIKSGDIGVGMGITGTDVTKNVADIVLADDNFATIVSAVEEGRRIYDNIRKTIQFLLGSNLSEVISIFVATLMGFVLFEPVHLLFINLITDSIPAVALGMEHAQPGLMERPPRGQKEGIFSGGLGIDVIYQGFLVAALTLISYFIVDSWHDHDFAMTAAFLTMSMCEIFHSFNMRSQRQSVFTLKKHNTLLWGAMALSLILSLTIIYVPFLASIFSLKPLTVRELIVSLGLSISVIPIVECVKLLQRAFAKRKTAK